MEIDKIQEWQKIVFSFVIVVLILRIIFLNEAFIVLLKAAASVYWVFVLPGIGLTYLLRDLTFIERFAASVAIGAALVGVSSYYLGLLGVHIKYSAIVVPAIFIAVSAIMMFKGSKKVDDNTPQVDGTHS